MKILVVCQHYWPENFPSTDLCEGLKKLGHEVWVVTDVPNYPMGYIFPEYKKGKRRREEKNGVKIFRTFTVGRRSGILFRLLNYYSFAISSTLFVKRLPKDFDCVLAIQSSPIMMTSAALSYARRAKKKCLFYTMDLWPASLGAGGIREGSLIYKLFGQISQRLYRKADRILVTSRLFAPYLREQFGIGEETIGHLPQYAHSQFDELPPAPQKEGLDLMFAGNVGAAQSLDTVLKAAALLQDIPNLRWHIVGDGSALGDLKDLAASLQLTNVTFHGRRPPQEMPQYYAMADAMVVSLTDDPYIGLTLPAKVQSYMAAGKPILASANGEIPLVLQEAQCGYCAPAEDPQSFADAVRQFVTCDRKEVLGQNAKAYCKAHFNRNEFMKTLEQELYTCAK